MQNESLANHGPERARRELAADLAVPLDDDALGTLWKLVEQTSVYPHAGECFIAGLLYTTLGLTGEAGELANKVKKVLRGDYSSAFDPRVHEALLDELADCLWYITAAGRECGITPTGLIRRLDKKLRARQAAGTIQGEGDKR